jgi:hypothetical protein
MKHYRLMTLLAIALILSFMIAMKIAITTAYERGQNSKACSYELKDICTGGYKENGFESNYQTGYKSQIFECLVRTGSAKIEDDFIFEGDWEKCDSNGKNCIPIQ